MTQHLTLLLIIVIGFVTGLAAPTSIMAQDQGSFSSIQEAVKHVEDGDYKSARKQFNSAIENQISVPRATAGLAYIDMLETKWPQALKRLNGLLEDYPDYLYGRYLRAITNREIAKFRTLNQSKYWDAALSDFTAIEAQDSSYKDVIYQHALWYRYKGEYEKAIQLGHLQLEYKPDSLELAHNLFTLYDYYLRHTEATKAQEWLSARSTSYDRYFLGESFRRNGQLDEADDIFNDMIFREKAMAIQPIYLSRARVFYQRESPIIAQSYVRKAIEAIENRLHALLVMDDFKYLLQDAELELFESLQTEEEWQAFFDAFWAQRDPTPARPENIRMTEHYRRLLIAEEEYEYDGFRLWHNNPDRLGALQFPRSYTLNEEFNDKGLIFIRHGEPDDREIQVGGGNMEVRSVINNTTPFGSPVEYSTSKGWQPNESWRYTRPERMDFHFVLASGGANAWRLVPELTNIDVLVSREHWGPLYYEMADAARALSEIQGLAISDASVGDPSVISLDEEAQSDFTNSQDSVTTSTMPSRPADLGFMDANNRKFLEFSSLQRRMVDESVAAVELALTTDQHSWEEEVESIPMPYQMASFRGEDNQTRVEIYFAIPIGKISERLEQTKGSIEVEMGYAVHDTSWHEVLIDAEAKRLPAHAEEDAAAIDFFSFSVPPDSYNVSLYSRSMNTSQLTGYKFPYTVPDYTEKKLSMSDILMADFIGPARSESRFDRGSLHVSPNPFHRYSTSQRVFIYFELYNLTLDSDDLGQFTVEYVLTTTDTKRGLFRRKPKPLLTLQIDRTAETISPVEYAEIDVSNVDPGTYLLTIRITDKTSGATIERSRTIELYE